MREIKIKKINLLINVLLVILFGLGTVVQAKNYSCQLTSISKYKDGYMVSNKVSPKYIKIDVVVTSNTLSVTQDKYLIKAKKKGKLYNKNGQEVITSTEASNAGKLYWIQDAKTLLQVGYILDIKFVQMVVCK